MTAPVISEPGVYELDEKIYHADTALAEGFGPSLSSTGAKTLLHAPAKFKWERENKTFKRAFDLGHAVHGLVLGVGEPVEVLDFPDRRTKAYKEAEALARLDGKVPILKKDWEPIKAMADEVLAHPIAKNVFADGVPERSIYAVDDETGVTMRGRVDWLRDNAIVDLKTTAQSAHPWRFAKQAADFGYDMQAAWYSTILAAVGHDPEVPYLHVVVETEPPYLVSVVQLDDESMAAGAHQARKALDLYKQCVETDTWPGYPEEITPITLPAYHLNKHL